MSSQGIEEPARARSRTQAPAPEPEPGWRRWLDRSARGLWLLAVLVAVVGAVAMRDVVMVPRLEQVPAVALGGLLAVGLAARSGGSLLAPTLLALAIGGVALATQWTVLLAGAALGTAVLAACLAVLGTVAATGFVGVAREVLLAELLAAAGALGVAGFDLDLDATRLEYTVLAVAMVATIALVYRLGGGLHGLGRSGVVVGIGALLLLAVSLAYAEALARYGSTGLIASADDLRAWIGDHLGAVPFVIELLVGVPALAWGVSLRTRRRQGWWVCVFGAAATASVATRLATQDAPLGENALSAAYGVVLGLAIGWVLIRIEVALSGTRGRRARRSGTGVALRPEPSRLQPLQ